MPFVEKNKQKYIQLSKSFIAGDAFVSQMIMVLYSKFIIFIAQSNLR